jgi:hypothetical protein
MDFLVAFILDQGIAADRDHDTFDIQGHGGAHLDQTAYLET